MPKTELNSVTKKQKPQLQSDKTPAQCKAQLALHPVTNAAAVIASYQNNVQGKDVDFEELAKGLLTTVGNVKDGDLSSLEAMLIGQATALQAIFTSLARRSQQQEYQKNLESFLSLALKAQAQSRATIQAVVELKYPRQVAFVKQANISHGLQQVNNGTHSATNTNTVTRTEENHFQQNKLLEDDSHGSTYLDTSATTATSRSNQALEAVGTLHRAKKPRG
jgi:hypothetical protein